MLTTDQKGAIAGTAVVHAAVKLGFDVYRPVREGGRYDLIIDVHQQLLRVQCKWAPLCGDVIAVRCYSTCRAHEGLRKRVYTADEIDAIAAYCQAVDRCFLLMPGALRPKIASTAASCAGSQQLACWDQVG